MDSFSNISLFIRDKRNFIHNLRILDNVPHHSHSKIDCFIKISLTIKHKKTNQNAQTRTQWFWYISKIDLRLSC